MSKQFCKIWKNIELNQFVPTRIALGAGVYWGTWGLHITLDFWRWSIMIRMFQP